MSWIKYHPDVSQPIPPPPSATGHVAGVAKDGEDGSLIAYAATCCCCEKRVLA